MPIRSASLNPATANQAQPGHDRSNDQKNMDEAANGDGGGEDKQPRLHCNAMQFDTME